MKARIFLPQIASRLLITALAILVYIFTLPSLAQARNNPSSELPALEEFVGQIQNGEGDTLRGIYIPNVLALPVVQQPRGNSSYVSPVNSTLTEFSMAQKTGNVGLLAHNYLAGNLFFEIEQGDTIILVYGNARIETFTVTGIYRYEALPNNLYKNIETRSLQNIGELFDQMYEGGRHVTLQTCIERDGDLSWGRLFIVANSTENQDEASAQIPSVVVAPPPPPTQGPSVVLGWPLKFKLTKP